MIYDYYCLDCGRKFDGGNIRFDMAELLGFRKQQNDRTFETRATMVDFAGLNVLAKKSGITDGLRHGEACVITISLSEFLKLMAGNEEKIGLFEAIDSNTIVDLSDILKELYTGLAGGEEKEDDIANFEAAIKAQFTCRLPEMSMMENPKLDLFEASFKIKPFFLEDGDSDKIYSLEYNEDIRATNLRKIGPSGTIRGYCPNCGKPIVEGAGIYQHTLVGLLGVQKAGKTSTIIAILEELRTNFSKLGIRYPGRPLQDSRSDDRDINIKLYQNSWAVRKTAVENSEGSFNATLLIESDNNDRTDPQKKQIITFVDIAGEQCYDLNTHTLNMQAFQVYPLINSCHIFLLCIGIAPEEEDRNTGEMIPPEAVLEISRGIYNNLKYPENIPPICIVATKADLASGAEARKEKYNPFSRIMSNPEYLYKDEIQKFGMLYDSATDEDVRNSLDICQLAYDELARVTYVSMMSCWALGRKAEKLPANMNIHNITPYLDPVSLKPCPFTRMRIDCVCEWIFQTAGIKDIGGYSFAHIPSYGEGYEVNDLDTWGIRKLYSVEDACDRIEHVKRVFINCPEIEDRIQMELRDFEENTGMLGWLTRPRADRRRREAIAELLGR